MQKCICRISEGDDEAEYCAKETWRLRAVRKRATFGVSCIYIFFMQINNIIALWYAVYAFDVAVAELAREIQFGLE